ncbi:MAG: hypothetical protein ABJB61_12750 [bacterium]
MITGFAIGNKLDHENRNRAQQQNMDKATFVQKELEDKPNDEQSCANQPHREYA